MGNYKNIILVFFLILISKLSYSQKIYITEYKHQADIKIYFVDYKHQADRVWNYVDYRHQTKMTETPE